MEAKPRRVRTFVTGDGKVPFEVWLDSLRDPTIRARVDARIARLRTGNFGDCRAVGEGVMELRLHFGSGYRVYFGEDGEEVILLWGGEKSTQDQDVRRARDLWREYWN